jgi:hypothetical protein
MLLIIKFIAHQIKQLDFALFKSFYINITDGTNGFLLQNYHAWSIAKTKEASTFVSKVLSFLHFL